MICHFGFRTGFLEINILREALDSHPSTVKGYPANYGFCLLGFMLRWWLDAFGP